MVSAIGRIIPSFQVHQILSLQSLRLQFLWMVIFGMRVVIENIQENR